MTDSPQPSEEFLALSRVLKSMTECREHPGESLTEHEAIYGPDSPEKEPQ
jgi:hypothetical protein